MAEKEYRVVHAFYAESKRDKVGIGPGPYADDLTAEIEGLKPKKVYITRANQHEIAEHLTEEQIGQHIAVGNLIAVQEGQFVSDTPVSYRRERDRFLSTASNSVEIADATQTSKEV